MVNSLHSANPPASVTLSEQDLAFDQQHIWHPYTSMNKPLPVYPVASASGVRLTLDDGRELIDGMSSWWAAIHGYNHPVLNAALSAQTERMAHVMFGGITHRPAVDLARRLVDLTPASLQHVFFCDSGSVAIEVAIKMAFQYWFASGEKGRNQLLTVRSGYHGDTFQAMSVCDPVTGMHEIFSETLPKRLFAPGPRCRYGEPFDEADFEPMAVLARAHHKQLAAIILEPVVQGAGGMWFYHPEYLRRVRDLCDELDLLLIADEIATGFGRSGQMFASEHADIAPDILCLGKALTGGYLSLAATLASTRVAQGISRSELNGGVLMHGPTYMANPLACAVACASIDLLLQGQGALSWQQNIERIQTALANGLGPCAELAQVADVRTLGAIGVVEMREPVDVADIQAALVNEGVWVRPFGRLIYLMPPYVISDEDLATLCAGVVSVVGSVSP
ncbi:MAG: adenosylmethionine--8-amino-7-oxononanoate transaminase [Lysobacterales bacterium]